MGSTLGKSTRKGQHGMESLTSGTMAGAGSFRCEQCGYMLTLAGTDTLSDCPGCGGRDFVRASLFSAGGLARSRITGPAGSSAARSILAGRRAAGAYAEHGGTSAPRLQAKAIDADTLKTEALGGALSRPEPVDGEAWLEEAREQLGEPGEYLAYADGERLITVALTREWTRIGRSLAADVRFDDPTVSRRHALVVRQADGVRVLDDRSLNGVFVNGSRIDRSGVGQQVLRDGDEIVVGRYRLRFLSIAPRPDVAMTSPALHGAG
jgi:predicted  nucleic acid-binding Zn-ribbon protein